MRYNVKHISYNVFPAVSMPVYLGRKKLNIYHNKIDYLHEVSIAYYINVFTSHGEVLLKPIFCVLA